MRLVGVDEDRLPALVAAARASGRMPDVMTLPLAAAQSYAKDGVTDPEAAARDVGRLGADTFSERALALLGDGERPVAVPSDGWGQLIIYRRDTLDRKGLPIPDTVEALRYSADHVNRPGRAAAGRAALMPCGTNPGPVRVIPNMHGRPPGRCSLP